MKEKSIDFYTNICYTLAKPFREANLCIEKSQVS